MRFAFVFLLVACAPDHSALPTTAPTGTTGATGTTGTPTKMSGGAVDAPTDMLPSTPEPTPTQVTSTAITTVTLEIDYQNNAAPFTGSSGNFSDVWQIFRDNAAALMPHKTITVPSTLAAMQNIPVTGTDFDVAQILAIAGMYRGNQSAGATAAFYVVFLDGYFNDDTGRQTAVLGVSIGATGVLALFKPVINSTGSLLQPNTPRLVEQATLVHEFGHAIGLVDNGLPMQTPHRDADHGKHCSNDKCTMFWQNEGPGALAGFLGGLQPGATVLFDQNCLDDAHASH